MLNVKCFCFNEFGEICSVAWDESTEALIIDPGCSTPSEYADVMSLVKEKGLNVSKIVLTHAHFDHIFGVSQLADFYHVPVVMSAEDKVIVENNYVFCRNFGIDVPDASFADGEWAEYVSGRDAKVLTIKDGDVIEWGKGRKWEVLATPGHTPGGLSFLDREAKLLFGGDTLFAGSIGRTDNQWGDYDALIKGIFEKLMVLDGDITVIPGHGPHTTIADERTKNPFIISSFDNADLVLPDN